MNSNLNFPIPNEFFEKFSAFMKADETEAFFSSLSEPPTSGIRVNTLKCAIETFREISPVPLDDPIPWCSEAYFLPEGVKPGTHPYHLAGLYYLQDPSAMTPAEMLDPRPGELILDLSAAPGGKTTQIAAKLAGKGILVANEIKNKRLGHLIQNVERWGAMNVMVTNETPERLADTFGPIFDRVLVDAPCSGEGMFRKDASARRDWNQGLVLGCAVRQTNILNVAVKLVKPGGCLVYSTCTFSPEEDEGVIAEILSKYPDFKVEQLPKRYGASAGKPEWIGAPDELVGALRMFPHQIKGEGHFVCRIRRQSSGEAKHPATIEGNVHRSTRELWEAFIAQITDQRFEGDRLYLDRERLYYLPEDAPTFGNLRVPVPGLWLGYIKKDRFEPAHPLSLALHKTRITKRVNFSADSAEVKKYLRGETLESELSGWLVVTVDGYPLGWGKAVNGILKNHYPKGWLARG